MAINLGENLLSWQLFINLGSLSSDELLRQFMQVLYNYELICVQSVILCDAVGQNERLYTPLCNGNKVTKLAYPFLNK